MNGKPDGASVAPLLDAIVEHVPPPAGDTAAPFAMLVAMVEHDAFLGPIATGRVAAGTARVGDHVRVLHHTGELPPSAAVQCSLPTPTLLDGLLSKAGTSKASRLFWMTSNPNRMAFGDSIIYLQSY